MTVITAVRPAGLTPTESGVTLGSPVPSFGKGKGIFFMSLYVFRSSFPARSDRLWRIIKHALFLVERNIFNFSRYFKCNAESSASMLHLWTISVLELTIGNYCNYAGIFCLMISLHRIVPNRIEEIFSPGK